MLAYLPPSFVSSSLPSVNRNLTKSHKSMGCPFVVWGGRHPPPSPPQPFSKAREGRLRDKTPRKDFTDGFPHNGLNDVCHGHQQLYRGNPSTNSILSQGFGEGFALLCKLRFSYQKNTMVHFDLGTLGIPKS